ncbi:MAG: SDR family oxidoreductase [Planctomycetota bacterium]|nr:SDR family oxidoreductase [Planctomycetota bacterium]
MSRKVLVTGGTRGIGEAIALAFAALGDQVLATGVEAELPAGQENIDYAALDVRNEDAIAQLVAGLPGLDVLVNCAGVLYRDNQEHEVAGFEEVVNINLLGTMRTSYACRSLLAEADGCVLNMASMLTFFGSGPAPGYSASKGGVAQLTRSLAIGWADEGIRVNAIAPGWIETALTRPLVDDSQRSSEIVKRTPLGRWGTVEDVTGAALFLCSGQAAFITGAILPVDGGYSVR